MFIGNQFLLVVVLIITVKSESVKKYSDNWHSLDTRPLPEWYNSAKIGIFLHWGVYSVPSFGGEWFWAYWQDNQKNYVDFMKKNYPPGFTYQDFASQFTAEFYNPDNWAELFHKAGAKYVVLTSKHHEGFTLFPSSYSFGWNAKDVGPKRDLLGDLAKAVRAKNITFGAYYSLYEWYHPLYNADKHNNFTTSRFIDNKMIPEMKQLVQKYHPEVIWADGDWEAEDKYFKSTKFLAWLYNDSPVKDTVVVNDRWGKGIPCSTHGDFLSCKDRFNPGTIQNKKWENTITVDLNTWGYRRNILFTDIIAIENLITILVQAISCGGNVLINVGPTKEGTIIPIFQERLLQVGEWLEINGEGIYDTIPWSTQNDTLNPDVWYIAKNNTVYAFVVSWPENNVLKIQAISSLFRSTWPTISFLGNEDTKLNVKVDEDVIEIEFPDKNVVKSQWVWGLKFRSPNVKFDEIELNLIK